jgi:hypothetical protein
VFFEGCVCVAFECMETNTHTNNTHTHLAENNSPTPSLPHPVQYLPALRRLSVPHVYLRPRRGVSVNDVVGGVAFWGEARVEVHPGEEQTTLGGVVEGGRGETGIEGDPWHGGLFSNCCLLRSPCCGFDLNLVYDVFRSKLGQI